MYILVALFILAPILFCAALPVVLYKEFPYILKEAKISRYNLALLLYCVAIVISGLLNMNLYPIILGFLCFFMYIVNLSTIHYCTSNEKIEKLLVAFFFFTTVSAVIGLFGEWGFYVKDTTIFKAIMGISTFDNSPDCMERLSATFFNPNVAATFLASALFVGAYLIKHRQGKYRIVTAICFVIIGVALLYTGSRGAIIGGFLGLLFHFIAAKKKQFIVMFAVMFMVIVYAMLAFPDLFERGELLFTSMDIRWGIWQSSWVLFLWQPLWGWGFMGTYFAGDDVYQFLRVVHPHNLILTVLVFSGLVGAALFIWLAIEEIIAINKLYLANNPLLPVMVGIIGVLLGQGIFDCTIVSPQGGVLFIAISAMIIAMDRNKEDFTAYSAL